MIIKMSVVRCGPGQRLFVTRTHSASSDLSEPPVSRSCSSADRPTSRGKSADLTGTPSCHDFSLLVAGVAQLARASAFQAEGRGFESRLPL
jgi:hypothetical protein